MSVYPWFDKLQDASCLPNRPKTMSYGTHTALGLSDPGDTEEIALDGPSTRDDPQQQHLMRGGSGGTGRSDAAGWGRRPTPPDTLPGIAPASTNIPLNSPRPVGSAGAGSVQDKLDSIRSWSISTYKYSRQLISEKLGKSSRTVDADLDGQIERLRETQRKYLNVLKLARALSSHFYNMINTQLQLSEQFAELGQRSPELQEEFVYNSGTQRALHKNGQVLLNALNFFVSSVNTLCNKTMDDTLVTIKQYETARVEYDAYRADLEWLRQAGEIGNEGGVTSSRAAEAQRQFETRRTLYENLRSDVVIKLRFLDENRVKVMHKQLVLFHNAVSSYFSGNQTALESTMKQFSVRAANAGSGNSFLEASDSAAPGGS